MKRKSTFSVFPFSISIASRTRGWFTMSSLNDSHVEIAYKKVGDGHPLRLWRCSTVVEAAPKEILNYILERRDLWQQNFLEGGIIRQLDDSTDIYQYAIDGQQIVDFCLLR